MDAAPRFFPNGSTASSGSTSHAANVKLNGWKAIAAHFGRDRTTVIRWARERNLPVYRVPGGRTGTVYALRGELDEWATGGKRFESGIVAASPMETPPLRELSSNLRWAASPLKILVLLTILSAPTTIGSDVPRAKTPPPAKTSVTDVLPSDPAISSQFLIARDLISERRTDSLEKAIHLLNGVTRDAPNFAAGYAALGEALLLSREFGKMSDREAFTQGRQAARTALRLDPQSVDGHRVLGFIAYWADKDFPEADGKFRRALAIDPDNAMVHFWYGNILSHAGRDRAALHALERARLLLPGSVAIQTDLAWAHWVAGEEAAAVDALHDILRRHPNFAVVHDCLSVIALLRGHDQDYVRHSTIFAQIRAQPELIAQAKAAQLALQTGGRRAMHKILLSQALEDIQQGHGNSVWAVTIASMMRDRDQTLAILNAAQKRREKWGDAGLLRRVKTIWSDDPIVTAGLTSLR